MVSLARCVVSCNGILFCIERCFMILCGMVSYVVVCLGLCATCRL
jgi:hypothetical protein